VNVGPLRTLTRCPTTRHSGVESGEEELLATEPSPNGFITGGAESDVDGDAGGTVDAGSCAGGGGAKRAALGR